LNIHSLEKYNKRKVLTGQVSVISSIITLLYVVFYVSNSLAIHSLLCIGIADIFFIVYMLNRRDYHYAARLILLLTGNLSLIFFASSFGSSSGIYLLYFPLICAGIMLFGINEIYEIIIFLTLPLLCLLFLYVTDFAIFMAPMEQASKDHLFIVSLFCAFAGTTYCFFYLIYTNYKYEKTLTAEKANLKAIFDSSRQMIMLAGLNFEIKEFNEKAKYKNIEIWGKDLKAGNSVYNCGFINYIENFESYYQRAVNGNSFKLECSLNSNERQLWYEVTLTPVLSFSKTVEGVLISILDITSRKAAEQQLIYSETILKNIYNASTEAIFLTDSATDNIINCNKKAIELFEVDGEDELKGKYAPSLQKDPITQDELMNIRNALLRNNYYNNEILFQTKKGRVFWGEITITRFSVSSKTFELVRIADITERKDVEKALVRAKSSAELAAAAKTQFLSNMSHEMRTPLNAVIGLTDLLLQNRFDSTTEEYLRSIKFSADNLLSIINDILDFSKIEAGKITIVKRVFNIREVIEQVCKSLHFKLVENDIVLNLHIEDDVPAFVKGDPVRFNEILLNLMGNAVKFTEKGSIAVNASVIEETEKKIRLQLYIEDTGIGIPVNKLKVIFESFTHAYPEKDVKYPGTGLGLAITKRLVELQGGRITVKSEPGKGSRFTFDILYDKAESIRGVEEVMEQKNEDLSGLKLLLVEDNKINQFVAIQILKKWNVTIETAINGCEALDMLKANDYDLVLMDLQMPEMNGFEAVRNIRDKTSEVRNSDIYVIALTADAFPETREKVLAAGMNDFISKPIERKVLLEKLQTYLNLKTA
jgi:PAS domain S-box-containing protein